MLCSPNLGSEFPEGRPPPPCGLDPCPVWSWQRPGGRSVATVALRSRRLCLALPCLALGRSGRLGPSCAVEHTRAPVREGSDFRFGALAPLGGGVRRGLRTRGVGGGAVLPHGGQGSSWCESRVAPGRLDLNPRRGRRGCLGRSRSLRTAKVVRSLACAWHRLGSRDHGGTAGTVYGGRAGAWLSWRSRAGDSMAWPEESGRAAKQRRLSRAWEDG